MKTKIIIPILAVVLVVVIAILGVNINNGRIPYNYKLYTEAEPWIYESYWESNKVRGAHYKIPDYNPDEDEWGSKYYVDETSPKTRTVVITDEEAFNEIFKESDLDVDYNKQMVILHIFTSWHSASCYEITEIKLDDEHVLKIHYKSKDHFGIDDATMPKQICFLVKMKKTDVMAVEFIEER